MRSSEISPGAHYAYRPSPRSREPFRRIEALERVINSRGKWEVRFLDDPHPGLEEYVRTACIIAPWSRVKQIERYERRLDGLREVSDRQWPGQDHPIEEAVNEVFAATGEDVGVWGKGIFQGPNDAVQRVADRAGLGIDRHGVAFEHAGQLMAPFATGLELARAFAAAEPGNCPSASRHSTAPLGGRDEGARSFSPRVGREPVAGRMGARKALGWPGRCLGGQRK